MNPSFGLIGFPLTSSKSALYHNHMLKEMGLKHEYSKYPVQPHELGAFIFDAKNSGIMGLSVTMPLKETIIPLLDEIDSTAETMGAVNTVHFFDGIAKGYNTDGVGALKALESKLNEPLSGKKVLIIGAGGAAKGIAWTLIQAGAFVTITNRTDQKAIDLAQTLKASSCPFNEIADQLHNIDILIQTTSVGMENTDCIIPPSIIPPHVVVFDILSAPKNTFLAQAQAQGSPIVTGISMWIYQAIEQYAIWLKSFDKGTAEVKLKEAWQVL